jgi:shikimate dehydrogenase
LGVANTVTNVGGELVGDSTDGPGFIDSLTDQGWAPGGKRCVVLGAGGAARAVVLALAEAGVRRVHVAARKQDQAAETAALAGPLGSICSVAAVADADLVVNATPVGMAGVAMGGVDDGGEGALPLGLDPLRLGAGQLVADLIYAPAITPLLAAARARGAETCNGLGMLIHQAARQVLVWTGRDAPVDAMSAAALRELRKRSELGTLGELGQLGEPGGPG